MKKPVFLRLIVIMGIIAGALSFQNCGPTFVTDSEGNVQYSVFSSDQSSIGIASSPSRVRSDFPPTTGSGLMLRGKKEVTGQLTDVANYNNCSSTLVTAGCNYGLTYRER